MNRVPPPSVGLGIAWGYVGNNGIFPHLLPAALTNVAKVCQFLAEIRALAHRWWAFGANAPTCGDNLKLIDCSVLFLKL